jgi:hypothetical protein
MYTFTIMKNILLYAFGICLLFLIACSMDKATTVKVENKNNYPLKIKLTANNCSVDLALQANEKKDVELIWTNIEKKDGSYQLILNHGAQGIDTFEHGFFTNGELTNYLELVIEKHEVKVRASE